MSSNSAASGPKSSEAPMSMVQEPDVLKQRIQEMVGKLGTFVEEAAHNGMPVHEVETGLWEQLRQMGFQYLGQFFAMAGDGDMGETVSTEDGKEWQRLEE